MDRWYCRANEFPDSESDVVKYARHLPPDIDMQRFRNSLTLRPPRELLQQLDVYYNLHWTSKRPTTMTGKLNKSVIMERRRALEWISDKELDWDNIDLST